MLRRNKPPQPQQNSRNRVLIQIFLNTHVTMRGYQAHHILRLVHTYQESTTDTTPANGATEASDRKVLERAFLMFNGIEPADHARDYYAAGNRSLSIGDVVAIDGRCYSCEPDGWQALHNPLDTLLPPTESETPHSPHH